MRLCIRDRQRLLSKCWTAKKPLSMGIDGSISTQSDIVLFYLDDIIGENAKGLLNSWKNDYSRNFRILRMKSGAN